MTALPWVRAGAFEGPLDLLLAEVRRQRVAIEDLEMAPLVARFLEYVRAAARRNLALDLEWLDMATTLIDWKARWLALEAAEAEEEKDPVREELVRLLTAHRAEIATELADRREQESRGFSKAGIDAFRRRPAPEPPEAEPEQFLSLWDLERKARELAAQVQELRLELAERRRFAVLVAPEEVTLEEMVEWLRQRMIDAALPADAVPWMAEQTSPERRVTLFLAVLETARRGETKVSQTVTFGPLYIGDACA